MAQQSGLGSREAANTCEAITFTNAPRCSMGGVVRFGTAAHFEPAHAVATTPPVEVAVEASVAPATRRAYRSDWRDFTGWCAENGREALPASPENVALYFVDRAPS